ncbi:MAG: PD-(D/E)XK nuclease family protein [Opitutaceae bacterium]
MSRTLIHLSWDQPFLPQLADMLARPCTTAPWDMEGLFIIVPTRQAGRMLREALALRACEAGTGLLAPRIVTPDWLLNPAQAESVASPADVVAAWAAVLLAADMESFRPLFPIDPPRRDAHWALGLGWQLQRLQSEVNEYGLDFAGIAESSARTDAEPERWSALASLEVLMAAHLSERGLAEPCAAKISRISSSLPPSEISRVLITGVLDPTPLALKVLERWSEALPVDVVVHGNPQEAVHDEWGRADFERVRHRTIALPKDQVDLRILKDHRELADRVSSVAGCYADSPRTLGICLADQRLTPSVAQAMAKAGLAAHDPAGIPLSRASLAKLAISLSDLATAEGPETLAIILRDPFFEAFAAGLTLPQDAERQDGRAPDGGGVSGTGGASLLAAFDALLAEHLPGTLASCLDFARKDNSERLLAALEWLSAARERLLAEPFCQALSGLLAAVLSGQKIRGDDPAASPLSEAGAKLRQLLASLAEVESRHAALPRAAWPIFLRQALNQEIMYPAKEENAWDLEGWLEIVFDDSPHLLIAGLNEGVVPESVQGDWFIPESLRKTLGMRTNEDRLARDRVLFEAALRSRRQGGRVDLLVPKISTEGDPLQPSKILFACEDNELIDRAKELFAPLPERKQPPRRTIAWKLGPPLGTEEAPAASALLPRPRSLSPSAIRCYLDCPFRYYLEQGLRLRPLDAEKRDLDSLDFGNLCHKALERLARDTTMQSINDEGALAGYLTVTLQEIAAEKLGRLSSFALRIQIEAAAARLRAAAAVEAEQRRQGWHTVDVEKPWTLKIRGHVFGGVIDRIDRHEDGSWRVIDYKTSDAGTTPEDAHWAACPRDRSRVFPASLFEHEDKTRRWIDLQLPLYLLALRDEQGVKAKAGYFVLPRTKEDTAVRTWESLSPEHLLHAQDCAIAVSEAIASGRFWPPSPRARWNDELARLFPDGIEADVDARLFEPGTGGMS